MPKISSVRDAKKFWLHPMSLAEVPAKPERRRATFSSRNSCAARSTLLGLPSCPFAEVCRTLEVIRLRPEGFGGRSSLQLLAPLVGKLGGSEQLENYNVFRCSCTCQTSFPLATSASYSRCYPRIIRVSPVGAETKHPEKSLSQETSLDVLRKLLS